MVHMILQKAVFFNVAVWEMIRFLKKTRGRNILSGKKFALGHC